jgi:predicted metalloprotease
MKKALIIAALTASVCQSAGADPMAVHQTAQALFAQLPDVEARTDLYEACGFGTNSNPNIGYCASNNTIFVSEGFAARPQASYEMAHVLGHAIQVRHGVADVALRAILNRRSEEDALRGMVTRQVDCVAGVLMASAGLAPADLNQLFATEPFTDAHWGRQPINSGPRVTVGLAARSQWYEIGYTAHDFAVCSVGEMSSDLIVAALR